MVSRRTLVALILVATSLGGAAVAQSPPPDGPARLCMTVEGSAPPSGWDPTTLEIALAAGAASITAVDDPALCAGSSPVGSPDSRTVSTLPIEVIDAGFRVEDGRTHFAAVLRNPNPNTWFAHAMAVRLDFFDAQGQFITTASGSVSLIPVSPERLWGQRPTPRERRVSR